MPTENKYTHINTLDLYKKYLQATLIWIPLRMIAIITGFAWFILAIITLVNWLSNSTATQGLMTTTIILIVISSLLSGISGIIKNKTKDMATVLEQRPDINQTSFPEQVKKFKKY